MSGRRMLADHQHLAEDQCEEWLDRAEPGALPVLGGKSWLCARRAVLVTISTIAGRPDPHRAYCPLHGGESRAYAECDRDWMVLAPPTVGGEQEVQIAGTLHLSSEHAYVIVRQLPPANGSRWIAQVGTGSHVTDIPDSRDSRADAERAGIGKWRADIDAKVASIRRARGGTLEWGLPIDPLMNPIVVYPRIGESADDAAHRQARDGVDVPTEMIVPISKSLLVRQRLAAKLCRVCGSPSNSARCDACAAEERT